ncbi:tetratricopeptide repeat protein [Rhodobacteraceae bacterium NNCM2]|nr:tetratricopeptide repeat protein [Coraliihabitans acroporae]
MAKRLAPRLVIATTILALMPMLAPAPAGAQGISGPYLAAEHAARRGDISEAARLYARVLARDPDNLRLMEQTMLHQVAAGQVAQAVVIARKLDRMQPGHHLGVLILAADGLKSGKYDKVRELLETGGTDGGPFVGTVMEAWADFGDGKTDEALELLKDLEENGTGGPIGTILAAYHAGLIAAAAGQEETAIEALGRAADASTNGGTNRLIRARAGALARTGEIEAAQELVAERLAVTLGAPRLDALADDLAEGKLPLPITTTPEQGAAEALFAISGYVARGNNRLIGLAYSRLSTYLDPKLIEAQLLIGDILAQDRQYGLAIEAYARVPEDAPEALDAQIGRAQALQDAGEPEEGLSVLRELVARRGDSIEAHTALGDMLRQTKRYEEAAVAYDGAVSLVEETEPRHWVLYYQRGITFERSKQWPKAEADFKKALELEPDQPLVLNYLGYSWVEMGENLAEAQAMIERAVEQRPDDGYIVDSLGWVLYRLGKFEESLGHMATAVELMPTDPVINDHYGDVLWVNGRKLEAEFQWRRALSFEPEEDELERIRRKLDVGLDVVLKEEAAEGAPALVGTVSEPEKGNGG